MKTKVCVCIATYNQEKFISRAIDSVLMQSYEGNLEIIIGNDFSTDSTAKILETYKNNYPRKIVLINRKKNLGMAKNFIDILLKAKGDYIAILDGDDYWTDKNKLRIQIDYLEKNQTFSISSHNVNIIQESNQNFETEWLGQDHREISTIKDILRDGSGGATCSLVFRRNCVLNLPKWFYNIPSYDWAMQVICTSKGKMKYFEEVMGVYWRNSGGITSFKAGSRTEIDAYDKGGVQLIQTFNRHFNYKYDNEISQNLYNYFYPCLLNIYLRRGDKKNIRKYASLILKGRSNLKQISIKEYARLLYLQSPLPKFKK